MKIITRQKYYINTFFFIYLWTLLNNTWKTYNKHIVLNFDFLNKLICKYNKKKLNIK